MRISDCSSDVCSSDLLSLGDVAGDLRRAGDLPLAILDRRHGQRDVDQASVLALPNGFIMVGALAAPDARQDLRFLVLMIRWNQDQDRLADDLVGRIAEEPLRTLIPARDDAVEVLAYDRVVGGLDDRGKPLFRYLRPLAFGDE